MSLRRLAPALLLAGAMGLSACTVSVNRTSGGDTTLDQARLEDEIAKAIEANGAPAADDISCPGDLAAKVGATIDCTVTRGSQGYPTRFTITSVDGGDVRFDINEVLSGSTVADSVSKQLTAKVGQRPDDVTCPDLLGKIGASIRCTLTAGGSTYGVSVTVDSADGDDFHFDIAVDGQPTTAASSSS